jgi:CRISPR system Cascade subunit CasE
VYLTRIQLNLSNRHARGDVADPYQMHSTLARLMSSSDDTAPSHFLWRCEAAGSQSLQLLLQSDEEPRHTRLDGSHTDWAIAMQTKRFNPAVMLGRSSSFRFRLRANPSVCREGKRHGLFREEEQLAWLHRQGERNGFRVGSATVSQTGRLIGQRRKGAHPVIVQAALFDGILQVIDADALCCGIRQGVGRAKHMGLGLLSLAPI